MDSLDRILQLKKVYGSSPTIQNIITDAFTEASDYLVKYPNQIIFDDDYVIVDFLYDDIFDRAARSIETLVTEARKRRALVAA